MRFPFTLLLLHLLSSGLVGRVERVYPPRISGNVIFDFPPPPRNRRELRRPFVSSRIIVRRRILREYVVSFLTKWEERQVDTSGGHLLIERTPDFIRICSIEDVDRIYPPTVRVVLLFIQQHRRIHARRTHTQLKSNIARSRESCFLMLLGYVFCQYERVRTVRAFCLLVHRDSFSLRVYPSYSCTPHETLIAGRPCPVT